MKVTALKAVVAILTVLLLIRILIAPPHPEGLVVLVDLDANELATKRFDLDLPITAIAEATGSEMPHTDELATATWILDASTREVVWQMSQRKLTKGRHGLAHVKADTFVLGPGRYEAYFASFGPTMEALPRSARKTSRLASSRC